MKLQFGDDLMTLQFGDDLMKEKLQPMGRAEGESETKDR